jgi:TolB-like protein/Tfp pilus assembly protein PilF/predicted Ser/Thr protein kinase
MANQVVSHDALVDQTLGHYRIVEKIGAGGMGEVYRGRDEHLDREVAIKVLPAGALTDASARKHFHIEALALSKLNHPNIATIYDFDRQQGVDFLAMEYIPGITLSEKLAKRPLPEKDVIALGTQLAEGLYAAHEHGVIHRDLKPGNLRLANDGRLKILDFGLAKLRLPVAASVVTESISETEAMAGTLAYMAPEQLLGGEIDARTDIHAAGSVLYEMATGQRPFAELERSQLISAILRRSPQSPRRLNPRVSPELERIVGKCLEKGPENRYQSAKELAVDLRRLQSGVLSGVQLAATAGVRWSAKAMRFGLLILAFVVAVLVALVLDTGGLRSKLLFRSAALPQIRSLAVLPLTNLSGDPQQDYFADGMTEALIAELGQISSLRVISRTSVMQYKVTKKPLPQIARELHVDAVIEGSVLRAGDRARITAQLIGAVPERHLWARNYERDLQDVLSVQSEIARAVANQVKAGVSPQVQARLASARPINPEAHEAYLKGKFFLYKYTDADLQKATEYAQQAIQIDPDYAPAYGLMALSFWMRSDNAYGHIPNKEAAEKTRVAAMKALAIDDQLAEPHVALEMVLKYHDWDWAGAEREIKRAIELNPNFALAHQEYAYYLAIVGREEESIQEAKQAVELDPFSPGTIHSLASMYFFARQYDQALEHIRNCVEMFPTNPACQAWLRHIAHEKGMYDDEVAAWQKAMELHGENPEDVAALGRAFEVGGIKGAWRWEIERQENRYEFARLELAGHYAFLGEKDQALDWLEKGYEQHDDRMYIIKADPVFDSLRSDPRFQILLRRMNFPE